MLSHLDIYVTFQEIKNSFILVCVMSFCEQNMTQYCMINNEDVV